MPNPDKVLVQHMLDAVDRIGRYVEGVSEEQFGADPEKQDAVLRQLQVLGEAARKVSGTVTDAYPEIPWRQIAGMRNKVIHEYFVVDLEIVWETAVSDVPILRPSLERVLRELK
jgi:uncharacterized protein with HEPN domain